MASNTGRLYVRLRLLASNAGLYTTYDFSSRTFCLTVQKIFLERIYWCLCVLACVWHKLHLHALKYYAREINQEKQKLRCDLGNSNKNIYKNNNSNNIKNNYDNVTKNKIFTKVSTLFHKALTKNRRKSIVLIGVEKNVPLNSKSN